MIKLVFDGDGNGVLNLQRVFDKHIVAMMLDAGMPLEKDTPVFMRTKNGVLAYTTQDGLDGDEHVFTWVTNEEKLTGEFPCNHVLKRGPGYTVYTSRRAAPPVPATIDEDDEL